MKTLLTTVALCSILCHTAAQPVESPRLHTGDLPGLEVTQTGHFAGNALFGYMDGGAELYREYGFVELTAQEFLIGRHQLLLEVFRMRDSLAAFGIFSVFRGECSEEDSTPGYWCSSPGQVLGATGSFFFRVQRLTGEAEGVGLARSVGQHLLRKLPPSPPILLPWCPTSPRTQTWQRKAILVRGPLGLQNSLPDWMDPLEPGGYSWITILPSNLGNTPATVGWIQCVSVDAAAALEQFIATFKRPGWRYIKRCGTDAFLVIEANLTGDRLAKYADEILNAP